jgi:hypothetical protein
MIGTAQVMAGKWTGLAVRSWSPEGAGMERKNVSDKGLGMHSEGDSSKAIQGLMARRKAVSCPSPRPIRPCIAGCYWVHAVLTTPVAALADYIGI